MCNKVLILFLLIYIASFVKCDEDHKGKTNSEDVFIPTQEWQVVKEGQLIPKGLHVRINLQTGLKEAKLLVPDDKQSTESNKREHGNQDGNVNALTEIHAPEEIEKAEDSNSNYSPEELKRVLKNIKSDENLPTSNEDDVLRIKEKFKDYETLKKELGDLNMSIKSDADIIRDNFQHFKDAISNKNLNSDARDDDILEVLVNLEYLVHFIDNANEFINLNGLKEIIYTNLNSSNSKIRSETLNVLGSCVQNNPKAQINALETGAVDTVLRLLALESSDDVKLRTLYALSGILRRFPLAQKQFLKNGGLNVFAKIFSKPENMKLQLKIITLLYDLLMEQNEALTHINNSDYLEKVKQYKAVNIKNELLKHDWCRIFNKMLIDVAKIKQDHDPIERCLNVMLLVSDCCLTIFNNKNLQNTLQELYNNYDNLSSEEVDQVDSFSYFTNLKHISHELLSVVSRVKTEL